MLNYAACDCWTKLGWLLKSVKRKASREKLRDMNASLKAKRGELHDKNVRLREWRGSLPGTSVRHKKQRGMRRKKSEMVFFPIILSADLASKGKRGNLELVVFREFERTTRDGRTISRRTYRDVVD